MKIIPRGILIIVLLLLGILLWASGKQEAAKGPRVLKFWMREDVLQDTQYKFNLPEVWAEFETQNNCTVEFAGFPLKGYQQKILASMAGGVAPDIINIDRSYLPGLLKEDALDAAPKSYSQQWLNAVTPDIAVMSDYGGGKMYGYAQQRVDIYGITWNKDFFKEAGLDPEAPPQDWEEFRAAAKKLAKYDGSNSLERVGYGIRHLGNPHGIVHKHYWAFLGAGSDIVTDPLALKSGKTKFNNEGGKAAIMLIHDMIYKDRSTSLEFPDPRKAFVQGLTAMQISELVSIRTRSKAVPDLKWGAALPPVAQKGMTPATNLNCWFFCVPSGSENKDLAWKALQWLTAEERDYAFAKERGVSPRLKVNWEKEPFASDPYIQSLKKMSPYGRAYPNHLALSTIMESLGAAIQKVWHNESGVEEALAEAQKLSEQAMAEVQ